MADHVLDAVKMAHAVRTDPQFSFPELPRTVPGLVTIPSATGLLVDGGPARQAFQGSTATRHLPRVLDALDGTRTPEALAADLELPSEATWPILSLLYTTGLIEDATGDPSPDRDNPAWAFMARSIDTTRVNRNGTQALDRLRQARVAIVTADHDGPLAEALARGLRLEGIDVMTVGSSVDVRSTDLIIAIGDDPQLEAIALDARSAAVTVLPVLMRAGAVAVGPLLEGHHTACASCAFRQRRMLPHEAAPVAPWTDEIAPWLVVRDVVAVLSRVGTSAASRFLVNTSLEDLVQTSHVIAPYPHCPICMDPVAADDGCELPVAWAYLHSVAFPPRETLNPKDHQVHYQSGNIALQRRHRTWPASAVVPLPQPGPSPRAGLRLDTIADLLVRTVGLRNGPSASDSRVDRWCATGGNLGSPTAYLIARRVPGLAAGVYAVQREDGSLARLTWADPTTRLAGIPDDPATVILTGGLDTVASKYGAFGWRIIHLDAGAAMAQANALARQAGLRLRALPVWNDGQLSELLANDLDAEPVTAVLSVTEEGNQP